MSRESVVKVLHGGVGDIAWLQRDFRVYLCNVVDTGDNASVLLFCHAASTCRWTQSHSALRDDHQPWLLSVLGTEKLAAAAGMEKRSLQVLLVKFYGVPTDKSWQKADWAHRPLSQRALEYAR